MSIYSILRWDPEREKRRDRPRSKCILEVAEDLRRADDTNWKG